MSASESLIGLPESFAHVDIDGQETVYSLAWHSCDSPTCPCTQAILTARPESSDDAASGAAATYEVYVDIHTSIWESDPDFEEPAEALFDGFEDAEWDLLTRGFYATKQRALMETDLSELGAELDFPVDSIQEDGELIPWSEHIPFDEKHFIEFGEHAFLVDDQYCVKRGCDCFEIVLSFIAARKIEDAEGFDDDFEGPVSAAAFNLKSGKWRPYEEDPAAPVADLMEKVLEIKGIRGLLRRRMKTLRSMYGNYLKAVGYRPEMDPVPNLLPPATAGAPAETLVPKLVETAAKKVGRNEPCTCGSGKKFKRCCL